MRLALALLLVPALAWGQPAPGLCPVVVPSDEPPGVATLKGYQAPFDGVCLTETRMTYYLCLDQRVTEAEANVAARDKAIATLEQDLAKEKTRSQGGWGFWVGVGLGAAAVLGLVIAVK